MKPPLLLSVLTSALIAVTGCDVDTAGPHAYYAKARTDTQVLLVSMEAYKEKNGHLPASLSELADSDPALARINLAEYTYGSNGIAVADGSSWLLSTPDPMHHARVIVGRLPIEVTNTLPAKPQGGANGRQPSSSKRGRISMWPCIQRNRTRKLRNLLESAMAPIWNATML